MSKMATPFEAQKPGKTRGKNSSAEFFIQATDADLIMRKLILGDIQDIILKTNVLQNVGGTNKPVDDDPLNTNFEGSSTIATKANTKPGNGRKPARDGQGASLHLARNRSNNLKEDEHKPRQKVSNLEKRTKTHTKPGSARNSAREGKEVMYPCRNRLNNLKKKSVGQKVSNPTLMRNETNKEGQKCRKGRRAAMPSKTTYVYK
jgi:hypothetical protein